MEEKILITCVKGIFCRQCPEYIMGELIQTRGVLDATVKFFKSEVTVKYDPQIITREEIFSVLTNSGYLPCEKGAPGSNPILNSLRQPFRRMPKK